MTVNQVMHAKSRQIEIDYHFVTEKVDRGQLLTNFVRSKDIHTKLLTKQVEAVTIW